MADDVYFGVVDIKPMRNVAKRYKMNLVYPGGVAFNGPEPVREDSPITVTLDTGVLHV